jgi:hypothetical protein
MMGNRSHQARAKSIPPSDCASASAMTEMTDVLIVANVTPVHLKSPRLFMTNIGVIRFSMDKASK